MMRPSSLLVFALKFLQKSMILTPWGPSAVPTGGAGVAFPAAIWSFTIACTFFAMILVLPPSGGSYTFQKKRPALIPVVSAFRRNSLKLLYLQKVQLDGR